MRRCVALITPTVLTCLIFSLPVTALAESYGAIAYSPRTGAMGWSHSYPSRYAAEQRALGGCASNARDCRIAIWFVNACGAVSIGPGGWGSAWGRDRYRAERESNRACSRNSHGCRVVRWQCSGIR